MTRLADRSCKPCRDGDPPLAPDQVTALATHVPEWEVVGGHHLRHDYLFPDFKSALAFVNRVGAIAEAENHHPDIHFTWGKVEIETHTHAVDGLSENDFVLAAKIDRIDQIDQADRIAR